MATRAGNRVIEYPQVVRLWSIHPRYLDSVGLVALWREALLAQAVLAGSTRGYRFHPQLQRFREQRNPNTAIAAYLHGVADEADRRGYAFDRTKILRRRIRMALIIPKGQLSFELRHLKRKVKGRNEQWYRLIRTVRNPAPHPALREVAGGKAPWERQANA